MKNQFLTHTHSSSIIFNRISHILRRCYSSNSWFDDYDELGERTLTPWVRSVTSGVDLLRNPKYNKGMAFTEEERDRHYLRGLLPPAYNSQEMQVQRVLSNLREYSSNLQRYIHLMALQERNERLFYRVMMDHIEDILPIVYTPTVGLVCQRYGLMFRRPRGLFVSSGDRGRVGEVLKNWPERRVRAIALTDGEAVLGLGDLGVQGMGLPVARLALAVACGGVHPAECLPVTLDVGTDNLALLRDPLYPGLRQRRLQGEAYLDLLDEFLESAKARYGSDVLFQLDDFAPRHLYRLLFQYRGSHLVFSELIQGTASLALAAMYAGLPLVWGQGRGAEGRLSSLRVVLNGGGEGAAALAELVATAMARERECSLEEARRQCWLVDSSRGLISAHSLSTHPSHPLPPHMLPFAHPLPHPLPQVPPQEALLQAVAALQPQVLISVSGPPEDASPLPLTQPVLRQLAENCHRPILLVLSSPDTGPMPSWQCTAQQAFDWTQGRCLFLGPPSPPASPPPDPSPGSDPHPSPSPGAYLPPPASTAYVVPGIVLGCHLSGCTRLRDEMLVAAAEALAEQVSEEDLQQGHLFPPLWKVRTLSAHIARAVAAKAYHFGLASRLPRPPDLLQAAHLSMYHPHYRPLR